MAADHSTRQIRAFRARLAILMALRECLRLSIVWVLVWATAVVGLRAVFRIDPTLLLWGGLGLAIAIVLGVALAVRQIPSSTAIRALFDRHGSLGGLLMAAGDVDVGQWSQKIAVAPTPALRWRAGKQLAILAASSAFLVAALLAPDRYLPLADESLQVGGEMEKLTERLQVLKQEQVLLPEKAEVLERDLDRIRSEALGKDPAKTMEALDHLEQSFSKMASEAAELAIKKSEQAEETQALAEALDAAQGQMSPEKFGEAMKDLADLAAKAAAENALMAGELSPELAEALRNGNLTKEQLQALAQALKDCKAGEKAKLMKLVQARLVDAKELRRCEKAGECDKAALIAALCDGKDCDEAFAFNVDGDGLPGRGGISRGRGDAAMTWQQEDAQKGDAGFKEQVLPPAAAASLKESRLVGISIGDPSSKEPGGGSSGGVLGGAKAGGGEARTQVILPEHEKTVQRYFDRSKK
jgi:hypothetical protein